MSARGLYDPAFEHDVVRRRFRRAARRRAEPRDGRARASRRSRTSSTAAPPGPTPAPATARGSSSRCPTLLLRAAVSFELPAAGRYGVAVCFLPQEPGRRAELEPLLEEAVESEGHAVARLARRAGRA